MVTPAADAAALARDPAALADALADGLPEVSGRRADVRVVHAPGRVNLIGEHTDYNEGFVLPVAIDLGIAIALLPGDDRRVEVTLAATGETLGFDLDAIGPRRGAWIDYVAGTAWALAEAGVPLRGVPRGPRLGPAAGLGAVVVGGAGAGIGVGAVRRRGAGDRPDGAGPGGPARGERLRRGQLRADGPVRVGVRGAGARAAARLPDARPPARRRCRTRTSPWSRATRAHRGSWSRPPTTSGGPSARRRSR